MNDWLKIIQGDCRETLKNLPEASIQCCVTSPPYWGLRDYGHSSQIGQEKTPAEFVNSMVEIFQEVGRVLKNDGTLWLNLGDSYASVGKWGGSSGGKHTKEIHGNSGIGRRKRDFGSLKSKDLVGIPWRVAFALQNDGWYLRSDIIWFKPNCMPESVTDRPTRSHEYIFLLTKSPKYFYDAEAIKEPSIWGVGGTGTASRKARQKSDAKSLPVGERAGTRPAGYKNSAAFNGKNHGAEKQRGHSRRHSGFNDRWDAMDKAEQCTGMRNKRDVWMVAPAQYRGAHFATFPEALITPCILAGSGPGDTILDPFGGSGTTGKVAIELGRKAILCELNPDYISLIRERTDVTPGLII